MQQSHRFSYLASDISKPGGSSSHIVDQVLGLILLTNTNVVHGVDHGVVLLRILLIEDLLHCKSLPVIIIGAQETHSNTNSQVSEGSGAQRLLSAHSGHKLKPTT